MPWYLNEYIINDKLVFKICKVPYCHENWELIETYIYYKDKFYTRESFRNKVELKPPKTMFKKLLEFFNKL